MLSDPGALDGLERVVGMLLALAASVASLWVIERRQRTVPRQDFKQARTIAMVARANVEESPRAEWLNVANAGDVDAQVSVERRRVVARGSIQGPRFDRIRLPLGGSIQNCLQMASGQLVLSGRYVPRVSGTQPYHGELQGQLAMSGPGEVTFTLPADNVTIDNAVIALRADGQLRDQATLTLANGHAAPSRSTKQLFTAAADRGVLVVTLLNGGT
jgi:hypothetical protein